MKFEKLNVQITYNWSFRSIAIMCIDSIKPKLILDVNACFSVSNIYLLFRLLKVGVAKLGQVGPIAMYREILSDSSLLCL